MLNGFVNVLKPAGATASDIVVKLRKVLSEKKIGHLGTLDPGAVGVLPIAVGQGTKLFNFLTNKQKVYRATFTFGITTDTLDSYGTVVAKSDIPPFEIIVDVMQNFVGEIEQIPPMYSAISVGGVRAYDLARQGVEVPLKARKVTVLSIDNIVKLSDNTIMLDITCSGGTYIRSLCRDIAAAVNSVAYMSSLIRLASGNFAISNALTYEQVEEQRENAVLDILYPISDLPTFVVDDSKYKQLDCGIKIKCDAFGYSKIYCKDEFFGVGYSDGQLQLEYYLKNAKN